VKYRLVWACGGLVALVAVLRILLAGSTPDPNAPSDVPGSAARPTPARSVTPAMDASVLSPASRRRLEDDGLPLPPPEAAPQEHVEYARILDAIRRGEDPLLLLAKNPEQWKRENEKRIRARMETARIRSHQERAVAGQQKMVEDHRARLLKAGLAPSVPGSEQPGKPQQ
jgi:hypothetical protein